jgi:osmotically-inducible protein OsmY
MNIMKRNWLEYAYVALLVSGLASAVGAQTGASEVTSGASSSIASTPPPASAKDNSHVRNRIKAALHADPYLNDKHIDVSVSDGVVVLSGLVFSDVDLQDALRIAQEAAGHYSVVDRLSIDREGRH